jgi:hypothetical protein
MLACGHAGTSAAARDVRLTSGTTAGKKSGRVPQQELQEDIQRFAALLMERTGQVAVQIMGSSKPDEVSTEALRRALTYESATLGIATEPLPEIAVLDMLVFLRLSRQVLVDYWIPKVFGERGRPFVTAFEQAEKQLWPIADRILSASQKDALIRGIEEWRAKNPELVHVEFVRLIDFAAARAGTVAIARAEDVRGVLSSVKRATQAADQAVLLGERALFLANMLPFVLRHQVRLGGREVVADTINVLGSTEPLAQTIKNLQPMVAELPAVEGGGTRAAHESRLLLEDLKPLIPTPEQVARLQHTIESANGLIKNADALIGDLRATAEKGPESALARVASRVDATMGRALAYLIVLGAIWSILWWGGYAIVKRFVRGPRGPANVPT